MKNLVKSLAMLTVVVPLFAAVQASAMTAEAFSQLSPQAALKQSHQWHRTGEASVKVLPNVLEAQLPNGEQVSIPLDDAFLLSIAPFVTQTHPCTYHVPTGCQGEMVAETMQLSIVDQTTGKVIREETVTTQKDGFIDIWMPRDGEYEFTLRQGDRVASEVLSTKGDSRTCITTMQLVAI
ncbi:CueP family metal-binding protein [Thaumasiovibrio subtropicus]|uniref:CueP family metal-binding protein n=1 Tax=Thaumasiovibrio subtropicus TaxID=1891207 RepID=UPI000B35FF11|nr:CueP family metal-binding protein [Thaumasiovibrio subtropicus]